MKYRKSSIVMLTMAIMLSCSNDNEFNSGNSEYVNSVRVTVEDFQPESPSTRTAYTVDGSGFHFQWVEGDALGIYPVGGDQVKFPISNGDGAATASFDGGAWKLRSEYQYAAYYPFSAGNYTVSERALPVSFTGQTQNGNGSTAHLGAYDYLACAATTPDVNGGINLTMRHLAAFLRLQLTMPKADTYSSVVLESNGAKFVAAGTFNLTTTNPAITPTATSSTYTINLTNVATTGIGQMVTVYAMIAPSNLSSSNIKITVHGSGQTTYVQTVSGKNFAARSAYNIAVDNFTEGTNANAGDVGWDDNDTQEDNLDYVDLGLSVKWAKCNVGSSKPEWFGKSFTILPVDKYWSTYMTEFYNATHISIYASSFVSLQGTTLDLATKELGSPWVTPTIEQCQELYDNCDREVYTYNGVPGVKYTSKKNGKSIFFPNNVSSVISGLYCLATCTFYPNGASSRYKAFTFNHSSPNSYSIFFEGTSSNIRAVRY